MDFIIKQVFGSVSWMGERPRGRGAGGSLRVQGNTGAAVRLVDRAGGRTSSPSRLLYRMDKQALVLQPLYCNPYLIVLRWALVMKAPNNN